jgi:hypothetical protein
MKDTLKEVTEMLHRQVESAAAPFAESAPSRRSDLVRRRRQASRATSRPEVRTTAAVARAMGCRFVMVDPSAEAAEVVRASLSGDRASTQPAQIWSSRSTESAHLHTRNVPISSVRRARAVVRHPSASKGHGS